MVKMVVSEELRSASSASGSDAPEGWRECELSDECGESSLEGCRTTEGVSIKPECEWVAGAVRIRIRLESR